ncbi:MAG: MBL fold metallo-hydrolase [Senegalia sp. (in: firmicutes)]|uniref:MBL fold metallo-hydrolase n=1 Tax=Senegalia sp. (in: firmicutes) TaxID=1924098 RepID=UPI003F9E7E65
MELVTKVYEDIYMIEIILPNNPLKALNCYLIKGEDKSLIIDTGFNKKECLDALREGLNELNLEIKDTELFITHLHSDHSGMANIFKDQGVNIYTGEIDGDIINQMTTESYWKERDKLKVLFGLKDDKITFKENPGYKYVLKEAIDFNYLKEGDKINIGKYSFELVFIPGHTPGHMGLYEKKHKIFFSGDHILNGITPNIGFWGFEQDILGVYFNSLDKIHSFDIEHLFTAHRKSVDDHKKRIEELIQHHKDRLNEILTILSFDGLSVRDVASKMTWSIRAKDWDDFPRPQKWFATGEAMAHLEHLYASGKIEKEIKDGTLYFRLK